MRRSGAVAGVGSVDPLGAARRAILEYLAARGTTAIRDIPRQWPVTRYHIRRLVRALVAEGVAEPVVSEGGGESVYHLTALGERQSARLGRTEVERAIVLRSSAA
jgi:predicted ArsR family transcriptional regulator